MAAPLLVFLALTMFFSSGQPSGAEGVCGDRAKDSGEQCDDGNLLDGDGCSSSCKEEICGNGILDESEQCDSGAGNGVGGNDCSATCFIRFCGDGVLDQDRSEECDSGSENGVSEGFCGSDCRVTGQNQESSAPSSSASSVPSEVSSSAGSLGAMSQIASSAEGGGTKGYWLFKPAIETAPPAPVVPPEVAKEARAALDFLITPDSAEVRQYFSKEENAALEGIATKLRTGRRLKPAEKEEAAKLSKKFQATKTEERSRYSGLIKDFVMTPVSAKVVTDQNLSIENLVTAEIPVVVAELKKTAVILPPENLKRKVREQVENLKIRGVDIEPEIGEFEEKLADVSAAQVFSKMKSIKEAAENRATPDLKLSLAALRWQSQSLRSSLPVLEQEFGIKPKELEPLIDSLDNSIKRVGTENIRRVVENVDRIVIFLEKKNLVSKPDLLAGSVDFPHAAAPVRAAKEAGFESDLFPGDLSPILEDLAANAPAHYKNIFASGGDDEQKSALIIWFRTNSRMQDLLGTLRERGPTEMDIKYLSLLNDLERIGSKETGCAVSASVALGCIDTFMVELQAEVRTSDKFRGFIGNLQDFFGIGT